MLNKIIFEKDALNRDKNEALVLVELTGVKKATISGSKARQRLNISFAIDVSGSMQEPIYSEKVKDFNTTPDLDYYRRTLGGHFGNPGLFNKPIYKNTKLSQAKSAVIKALEGMKDGDVISIVTFDNSSHIIVPSTEINASNRAGIIQKINGLLANGSTNLHAGWLTAATEVAKAIHEKQINRVIVLSDGQTNSGVMRISDIARDVSSLYDKKISTTTFGIGGDFNEDLLQSMSNAGGGNSYYIENASQFETMFAEEFQGLSNLSASNIKVTFKLNEGFSITENLNKIEEKDGIYLLPNITSTSKFSLLLKLETKLEKDSKAADVGEVTIQYLDSEGSSHSITSQLKAKVVGKKKWESLSYNQEVKVQETLLTVANNKIDVTRALDRGDMEGARTLLQASSNYIASSGLKDDRLMAEVSSLDSKLNNATSLSAGSLRKSMAYESYNMRTGREKN